MHSQLYIRIMNSKEWQGARRLKLEAQPLCEECKKQGLIRAAQCVHHIKEIESGRTDEECWNLALSQPNLMSLCYQCHRDIHAQQGSHKAETHKQRTQTRLQQWIARHRPSVKKQEK